MHPPSEASVSAFSRVRTLRTLGEHAPGSQSYARQGVSTSVAANTTSGRRSSCCGRRRRRARAPRILGRVGPQWTNGSGAGRQLVRQPPQLTNGRAVLGHLGTVVRQSATSFVVWGVRVPKGRVPAG